MIRPYKRARRRNTQRACYGHMAGDPRKPAQFLARDSGAPLQPPVDWFDTALWMDARQGRTLASGKVSRWAEHVGATTSNETELASNLARCPVEAIDPDGTVCLKFNNTVNTNIYHNITTPVTVGPQGTCWVFCMEDDGLEDADRDNLILTSTTASSQTQIWTKNKLTDQQRLFHNATSVNPQAGLGTKNYGSWQLIKIAWDDTTNDVRFTLDDSDEYTTNTAFTVSGTWTHIGQLGFSTRMFGGFVSLILLTHEYITAADPAHQGILDYVASEWPTSVQY